MSVTITESNLSKLQLVMAKFEHKTFSNPHTHRISPYQGITVNFTIFATCSEFDHFVRETHLIE